MKDSSTGFALRGTDEPPPERRILRAGTLTTVLENGTLRYVRLGGAEVVRGLYAAVRDRNWGTVEPRFTHYEVEEEERSFRVRFTAEHESEEVDFVWEGEISGSENGTIRYSFDGVARRSFLKNRIGFCILHPMELAGTAVEARSPSGVHEGRFPKEISPHQPFLDIVAMRHSVSSEAGIELTFEGDLFEMEDQRNWTDASYKTYCTPLRLPFPAEIKADERVTQSVTLRVLGRPKAGTDASRSRVPEIMVGFEPIGTLPQLGFGVASHGGALSEGELERLRALKPAHLRVGLELADPNWTNALRRATDEVEALGAALEIEVFADDEGRGLDALAEILARDRPRVARLMIFSGLTTTRPALGRMRTLLRKIGLDIRVGGGSRAFFAELNRAELPLEQMDVVGYAISPQVHAFDDLSIVETLAAQTATVESARKVTDDIPLAIGPITLKMPFNPAATGQEATKPDELPQEVDPRQMSLFCAGWTVGSIRRLGSAGVASLTYYETTGWRGVMERGSGSPVAERFPSRAGMPFPVYYVFAELASLDGAGLLPLETAVPLEVEALALHKDGRLLVLVANLIGETRRTTVRLPTTRDLSVRVLDGASSVEGFRPELVLDNSDEDVELRLPPYAVLALNAEIDQLQKGELR